MDPDDVGAILPPQPRDLLELFRSGYVLTADGREHYSNNAYSGGLSVLVFGSSDAAMRTIH
jgi:hypothetical protein